MASGQGVFQCVISVLACDNLLVCPGQLRFGNIQNTLELTGERGPAIFDNGTGSHGNAGDPGMGSNELFVACRKFFLESSRKGGLLERTVNGFGKISD